MPAGMADRELKKVFARIMDAVCMQFRHNLERTNEMRGFSYVEKREVCMYLHVHAWRSLPWLSTFADAGVIPDETKRRGFDSNPGL